MTLLLAEYDNFRYVTDDVVFYDNINLGFSEPYPKDLTIIQQYLKLFPTHNRTYIDVGAHIGTTLIPCSKLFQKNVAYEPYFNNFNFMRLNIKLNNLNNCTVYHMGLLDEETYVSVHQRDGYYANSGCYHVTKDHQGSILCRKLDDECRDKQIDQVDFIKIDTEGSDLSVLRGAMGVIEQYKPLIQLSSDCSDKNRNIAHQLLLDRGYTLFAKPGNIFYYHPGVNTMIQRKINCFWTGTNPLTDNRLRCIHNMNLTVGTGVSVTLITQTNLEEYIIPGHPLHPAYKYLSETHRADYLRTYFMHFYGGGYADIKEQGGSWSTAFDMINNNPNIWISGYPEIGPNGIAYSPVCDDWRRLVGNCAYICRPNTPLTREWYTCMMSILDDKLSELQLHPAQSPSDCRETGSGYPIEWNEMLGRIFHRISHQYMDHINQAVPTPFFTNYR
jgi:FkbM family methyltransferase